MRLDYALYGLAVVLFVLSAIFFVLIPEEDGQLVYVVSTAVLGVLAVVSGLAQRPRPQPAATVAPQETAPPTVEPVPPAPVVASSPEPEPVPAPQVVEEPKSQPVEASAEPAPATPPEEAITIPMSAPELVQEAKSELTQIRGISENRVQQLKANGINTIQDLASASPDDLAVKLNVSPKIVKMWVGSAKKQTK